MSKDGQISLFIYHIVSNPVNANVIQNTKIILMAVMTIDTRHLSMIQFWHVVHEAATTVLYKVTH